MLQQTRVQTVVPYYQRFMRRFPDLEALAQAPIDLVLHHWSGLGYYARARNLHAAAGLIRERHGGRFPTAIEELIRLPGIGRSTAGAILALACGRRHPILDGNAKRVLARYHRVEGWSGDPDVERRLWALAEAHTPERRVAEYTQAIMDLGSAVCRRTQPLCGLCPVSDDCRARALGRERELPHPRPRKGLPMRAAHFMMVQNPAAEVLLERRPPAGVWGGLWSLPEATIGTEPVAWARTRLGVRAQEVEHWAALRHTFSHFRLDIHPVVLRVEGNSLRARDEGSMVWSNAATRRVLGLPGPVLKLLNRLAQGREGV